MEGIGKGGGAANSKDVSGAASDWRTAEARSRPVGVRKRSREEVYRLDSYIMFIR